MVVVVSVLLVVVLLLMLLVMVPGDVGWRVVGTNHGSIGFGFNDDTLCMKFLNRANYKDIELCLSATR